MAARRWFLFCATCSLVAAIGCASALAQNFGRFGYVRLPRCPGFEWTSSGFRAASPAADWLTFERPLANLRPSAIGNLQETLVASGDPSAVDINLAGHGFRLHVTHGVLFRLSSTSSPYLSWAEGTVRDGVPTAPSTWLLLSFSDRQPPLLLWFPSAQRSLIIEGKTGAWRIRSLSAFDGWVGVCLPFGTRPYSAHTAQQLGELSQRVKKRASWWTQAAPSLLDTTIEESPDGVTATWRFSSPGARVPVPLLLASLGGYPVRLEFPMISLDAPDESGPVSAAVGSEIKAYFPARRVPTGRFVSLGDPIDDGWAPRDEDLPTVVAAALHNLPAYRSSLAQQGGDALLSKYLAGVNMSDEPWTHQALPYGADGAGVDVAAANALLMQCLHIADRASSDANALLTNVAATQDWLTWLPWTQDEAVSRRAAALASVASALCPEPERRLFGAMCEAGLASERGQIIFRRRHGEESAQTSFIEPLWGIRRVLYALDSTRETSAEEPFAGDMTSELRAYGETRVHLESSSVGLKLIWHSGEDAGELALASAYPLALSPNANLQGFVCRQGLGVTQIRYRSQGTGECSAMLTIPSWAKPPPRTVPVPAYTEPSW